MLRVVLNWSGFLTNNLIVSLFLSSEKLAKVRKKKKVDSAESGGTHGEHEQLNI